MSVSIEQSFAVAINANPDDRVTQLVYADWLDEQGDPRAEAWRVLIEAGKRPLHSNLAERWLWTWLVNAGEKYNVRDLFAVLPESLGVTYHGFHAAMNAAAIAWVRCHRDAEFEPDELTERV